MVMLLQVTIFLVGIVLLYVGSEGMVNGSSRLATSLGIRPVIIGLTLVAFGTSAPELFIGMIAVLQDHNDIAVGNIIGSNIANIGLILGVAALISPLKVKWSILRKEMRIMIIVSIAFGLMALDLEISSFDGFLLLSGMVLFTCYTIFDSLKQRKQRRLSDEARSRHSQTIRAARLRNFSLSIIGLVGLLVGAQLTVSAAVNIARAVEISELIVGLTVIAVGTSLPELAVSTVAARRNEADISIGNVIGSNILNILLVIGVVSMFQPLTIEGDVLKFGFPVMLVFSVGLYYIMKTDNLISRTEGVFLLIGYVCFFLWLF